MLFDENLSPRLPALLSDQFPGSRHVRNVGLRGATDQDIWNFAAAADFTIVTKDPPLPAKSSALSDQKLTLGDAWLEVFQQVLPRNQFCTAGKLVARAYREEFGEEPPRRQQLHVTGSGSRRQKHALHWG